MRGIVMASEQRNVMKKILTSAFVVVLLALQMPFGAPAAHAAVSSWIKGTSIIPQSNSDFSTSDFQQSVRNFKDLGGNYINFIIPYYQGNSGSTDINPGWNTPTDDSLISGIQFVHSLGMRVQISIYLETYSGEWRATINPGDRNTWYARYGDVLVKYGQIAQQQGADLYQLGAELITMASSVANSDNTQRWNGMISRVRGIYSGPLTYSANRPQGGNAWASEASHIGFWDKMSYLGLSAYYELHGDGSVASLEGNWENLHNSLISPLQNFGKPILFTEIGYRSVDGAHERPWDSWTGGPYDAQEQINDYTALLNYWNKHSYMQGVVLWWWSANPNYGGSGNTDYTPQNKPAQEVLKEWWIGGGPPPPPPPPNGPVTFTTSGSASPSTPSVGQNTVVSASVTASSGSTSGAIIDLEVYDGGTRVFQQFFQDQNFSSGQARQYNASWTPGSSGTYTFKIGVFNNSWSQNYVWNDSAATVNVGSTSSPPPPPPPPPSPGGSAVTNIWWPSDGVQVTGVQPFKAMVENKEVSQYTMYWQVDAGELVPMPTNMTDYPHKEAFVDLTNWNWRGAGPYTVNFVSKDGGGATISQKSIQIWTQ